MIFVILIQFLNRYITKDDIRHVSQSNQYGVWVTTFYFQGKEIASMVARQISILSYELSEVNFVWPSKTVSSLEEAKEILVQKLNVTRF